MLLHIPEKRLKGGPFFFFQVLNHRNWADHYGNTTAQNLSPETAARLDTEVKKILDTSYEQATILLQKKRNELEVLAQKLLEVETLSVEAVKMLLHMDEENPSVGMASPKRRKKKGDIPLENT
jgi:ATP-dependent Zn protease